MAINDISINVAPSNPNSVGFGVGVNNRRVEKGIPPSFVRRDPAETPEKNEDKIYGNIAEYPRFEAIDGVKFDFNDGIRVMIPKNGRPWRVAFSEAGSNVYIYNSIVQPGGIIGSVKKYFINFRLELFRPGESTPAFTHDFNAENRDVMIQMPVKTLGDAIAWFPYAYRFKEKHNCNLIVVVHAPIKRLFEAQYPDVKFITIDETMEYYPYATYYLGLFFHGNTTHQPADFRFLGLHRTTAAILGVDESEALPRFDLSAPRSIKESYVCIAVQSSCQCKYWNNPFGWIELIKKLKAAGYRVLCMDKDMVCGSGINFNQMPPGVEDFTGNHPLQERIDIIKDADFFVGVSSGLSWLAWGCKVPVVMISGMTHPQNEFYTPYRVINYNVCNSCWNDMRVEFDHYDYLWCPRHKGTERHFECSKLISSTMVMNKIEEIPQYIKQVAKQKKSKK